MNIDKKEMQTFQDQFCKANHLYCVCLNGQQDVITDSYGSDCELEFLNRYVTESKHLQLVQQFDRNTVEEVIEEDTPCGFVRMCAIAIRVEKQIEIVWLVKGVIKEMVPEDVELPENIMCISQEDFYAAVQFLYTSSKQYMQAYTSLQHVKEEMKKSKQAKKRIEAELKRSEVMAAIIQMQESEQEFGYMVKEIMSQVCDYLKISGSSLLQLEPGNELVYVACQWPETHKENNAMEQVKLPKNKYPFWTGKPYMISSDSKLPIEFREYFEKEDIQAGIFLPIEVNHQVIMYLNFTESTNERTWDITDIKFLNDVKQIVQNVLNKRITKNSLTGSYVSLEAILENVGCGIYVKDMERNQTLFANEQFRRFFKNSIQSGSVESLFRKADMDSQDNYFNEHYVAEEDKWFDIHYTEIIWVNGRKVSLYTVYEITGMKRYQQKIERQANNDFLTGLYNRMRCEQDLSEYIQQSKELNGAGALLYMDLDDFKHINDGLGHRYGDVLLKAISQSIQKISGIENTCYRMGGDEFIIIVTQHQYPMLNRILKDIQEIFTKPWFLKGAEYYCTMSMGVVCFPEDGDNVQELIQKADIALYEAKKGGKNRYEFYSDNVETTSFKRLDLEKNMRDATMDSCNEFEVYYQPIFDVSKEGTPCCGAEALIRWNSRKLGLVSPAEFIPLAEYLGLINPIGNHVLQKACERCKYWNDMGHPEYKVNVNLSVVQLLQNDIVEKVEQVLKETRINPENLTLEVTESLAVNDMARMKKILGKIKELGVRVALDDFGTGYSSLNHIREMPVDVIKIDRCFIMDLGKDEFADVFVKIVGELADTIGMRLCVEGVETQEQYDKLKEMKISLVQGYFFNRPMEVGQFEKLYL